MVTDISSQGLFSTQVDQVLTRLGIPQTKVKHIKDAVFYVYQNLRAVLDYDYNKCSLKGPITILKSEDVNGDISIKKVGKNPVTTLV